MTVICHNNFPTFLVVSSPPRTAWASASDRMFKLSSQTWRRMLKPRPMKSSPTTTRAWICCQGESWVSTWETELQSGYDDVWFESTSDLAITSTGVRVGEIKHDGLVDPARIDHPVAQAGTAILCWARDAVVHIDRRGLARPHFPKWGSASEWDWLRGSNLFALVTETVNLVWAR